MKTSILLNVSVAQVTCLDGEVEKNLSHASDFVSEACKQGSGLVLFPEFMSQGYRLSEDLWNSAEQFDGPTTRWLCSAAREFGIYIGSSFLEANNRHFLNTFAMADPSGKIAGIVRKRYPSMWEAYYFRGSSGEHVFETDFGRVGVGICFDNHTYKVATAISRGRPDIILMPHSYCTPTIPDKLVTANDIERLNSRPSDVAELYNRCMGVPVVLCNKSGTWDSPVPNKMFGKPKNFRFSGRSAIIDADGTKPVQLDDREAVATGKVTLDRSCHKNGDIPKYSRYIYPGPAGREIIRLMELQGSVSYTLSRKRKLKAISILKACEGSIAGKLLG